MRFMESKEVPQSSDTDAERKIPAKRIFLEQQIWPRDLKEKYSKRVTVGGDECRGFDLCRNYAEMKDSAYCFASKQITNRRELPPSYIDPKYEHRNKDDNIYYAETQRKTGSINDYGQYLFAKLPNDAYSYKELTKNDPMVIIRYQPFLFTICVPVDINNEILSFSYCIFDKCEDLIQNFNNWRADNEEKQAEANANNANGANGANGAIVANAGANTQAKGQDHYQETLKKRTGLERGTGDQANSFADEVIGEQQIRYKDLIAKAKCKFNYNPKETRVEFIEAWEAKIEAAIKERKDKETAENEKNGKKGSPKVVTSTFRFKSKDMSAPKIRIKNNDLEHVLNAKHRVDPNRCRGIPDLYYSEEL